MKITKQIRRGGQNRRKTGLGKFLLITLLSYYLITCLSAADMEVKLNTDDGSTSFQVRDSGDVVVSSITSDGDASFSTTTINGNMTVKGSLYPGGDQSTHSISYDSGNSRLDISTAIIKGNLQVENYFYPGQGEGVSQGTRYIYDDAANSATRFSAAVYIEQGALRDASVESADLIVTSTGIYDSGSDTTSDDTNYKIIPSMTANLDVAAQPALIVVNFSAETYRTDSGYVGGNYRIMLNDATTLAFNEINTGVAVDATSRWPVSMSTAYRTTSTGNHKITVEYKITSGWTETVGIANMSMNAFVVGCP